MFTSKKLICDTSVPNKCLIKMISWEADQIRVQAAADEIRPAADQITGPAAEEIPPDQIMGPAAASSSLSSTGEVDPTMLACKLLEMQSAVHRLAELIADPALQPPVHPKAPPLPPMIVPPLRPPAGYTGLWKHPQQLHWDPHLRLVLVCRGQAFRNPVTLSGD